jgi:hypothetical protein
MSGDSGWPGEARLEASEAGPSTLRSDTGDPAAPQDEVPAWAHTAIEEGIRPLAIAAMLTCIAVSISGLALQVSATWPSLAFAVIAFLVSLEGIHSRRRLSRLRLASEDKLRFHFVEIVVLFLLVRFGLYISYGVGRLVTDLASWTTNIGSFFDVTFLIVSLFTLGFWALAGTLSQTIQEMETSPIERTPSTTDPGSYLRDTMPGRGRTDRQGLLNRIVGIFFWGGVILLILSGLARVNLREVVTMAHGRTSGAIVNALVYFLLGFLIVSEAQYTILKANWELQDIPLLGRLGRRWLYLVVGFLVMVGVIAALLPAGYSVGILDVLLTVVRWVIWAVVQLTFFILFVISWLLGSLMQLFMGQPTSMGPAGSAPRMVAPPAPVAPEGEGWAWWPLVRSLIFWLLLTGVMGYSLFHFIGDRWGMVRWLSGVPFLAWLRRLWGGLRRGAGRVATRVRAGVAQRLAARRARAGARAWRYFSLRGMTPRDRVRYYYLSVLHRSAREGFGRPPAATPLEYDAMLAERLPEVTVEVHRLSQAFVEARYSEHSITHNDAEAAKGGWQRLRRALAQLRRRGRAEAS